MHSRVWLICIAISAGFGCGGSGSGANGGSGGKAGSGGAGRAAREALGGEAAGGSRWVWRRRIGRGGATGSDAGLATTCTGGGQVSGDGCNTVNATGPCVTTTTSSATAPPPTGAVNGVAAGEVRVDRIDVVHGARRHEPRAGPARDVDRGRGDQDQLRSQLDPGLGHHYHALERRGDGRDRRDKLRRDLPRICCRAGLQFQLRHRDQQASVHRAERSGGYAGQHRPRRQPTTSDGRRRLDGNGHLGEGADRGPRSDPRLGSVCVVVGVGPGNGVRWRGTSWTTVRRSSQLQPARPTHIVCGTDQRRGVVMSVGPEQPSPSVG